MSLAGDASLSRPAAAQHGAAAISRDTAIDTMRGIAILMVIGIHALHAPAQGPSAVFVDAALRPCVPIFLFASGYLTARSGQVPLGKRLKAVLPPYITAFAAAYLYMALNNPGMDHRPLATVARFGLAYVFVYYYVFVYIGCTIALWLVYRLAWPHTTDGTARLVAPLLAAILIGLASGAYLDPLLARLGASASLIEEARLRDIPFWFTFTALGALVALWPARRLLTEHRNLLIAAVVVAYAVYALVRYFGIGDAAAYDSPAFFLYAAALCLALLGLSFRSTVLSQLGAASYFIYLWHIFFVLTLRDHTALQTAGTAVNFLVTYAITLIATLVLLAVVRRLDSPLLVRWTGA